MKPEKCYACFLSYWYDHDSEKLQTVGALPECIAQSTLPLGYIAPLHLRVPLPDGSMALIPMLANDDASLMPGIYFGRHPAAGHTLARWLGKGSFGPIR